MGQAGTLRAGDALDIDEPEVLRQMLQPWQGSRRQADLRRAQLRRQGETKVVMLDEVIMPDEVIMLDEVTCWTSSSCWPRSSRSFRRKLQRGDGR